MEEQAWFAAPVELACAHADENRDISEGLQAPLRVSTQRQCREGSHHVEDGLGGQSWNGGAANVLNCLGREDGLKAGAFLLKADGPEGIRFDDLKVCEGFAFRCLHGGCEGPSPRARRRRWV